MGKLVKPVEPKFEHSLYCPTVKQVVDLVAAHKKRDICITHVSMSVLDLESSHRSIKDFIWQKQVEQCQVTKELLATLTEVGALKIQTRGIPDVTTLLSLDLNYCVPIFHTSCRPYIEYKDPNYYEKLIAYHEQMAHYLRNKGEE